MRSPDAVPRVGSRTEHNFVMGDLRFRLKQILFILGIVNGPLYILSGKFANRVERFP